MIIKDVIYGFYYIQYTVVFAKNLFQKIVRIECRTHYCINNVKIYKREFFETFSLRKAIRNIINKPIIDTIDYLFIKHLEFIEGVD